MTSPSPVMTLHLGELHHHRVSGSCQAVSSTLLTKQILRREAKSPVVFPLESLPGSNMTIKYEKLPNFSIDYVYDV